MHSIALKHAEARLECIKNATTGLRIDMERMYERRLQGFIITWYRKFFEYLWNSGYIIQITRDLAHFQGTDRYRRNKFNVYMDGMVGHLDEALHQMPEYFIMQGIHKQWMHRFYCLGAVKALKVMKINARCEPLDDFLKSARIEVAKAEGFDFGLTDDEVIAWLDGRAVVHGESTTDAMIQGTRQIIRDDIFLGEENQWDAAKAFGEAEGIAGWQARRIFQTEAGQAFNRATNDMYVRSGVKMHAWVTVKDRRVREAHRINEDAGFIEIGEPFPGDGSLYPGDGISSINCRCSEMPDLSDPSMLLQPWDGGSSMRMRIMMPSGLPSGAVF